MDASLAYERIVQLLGCKWSVRIVLELDARGPSRPSELLRSVEGLAPRVLHRCLARMEADGLLQKQVFACVPPRSEYSLTEEGREFVALLRNINDLAERWEGTQRPVRV
jgi:DNA-binding HxlR family transcriptional regulator